MALASELLPLLPICLMRTVQSRESFVSTKSESNVNAYSIYIYIVYVMPTLTANIMAMIAIRQAKNIANIAVRDHRSRRQ